MRGTDAPSSDTCCSSPHRPSVARSEAGSMAKAGRPSMCCAKITSAAQMPCSPKARSCSAPRDARSSSAPTMHRIPTPYCAVCGDERTSPAVARMMPAVMAPMAATCPAE
eukprot:scaffold58745_cov66-Phaeocystis_antarctica.AAC.7